MTDEKTIKEYLKNRLSGERYAHSVSVANTAKEIAEALRLSAEDLREIYEAGLLHDIAKEVPKDEQIKIIEAHGVLSDDDRISRSTLHQLAGAYLARDVFGINDRVFGMIRYHCTGSPDMTLCEKIIFISDYIEPLRKHGSCVELRGYFMSKPVSEALIDETVFKCCERTLALLTEKNYVIHPLTKLTYEKFKQNL